MNMAKKRPNVIPIIEDARHPQKYRMLVPMVDVIFAGGLYCDCAKFTAAQMEIICDVCTKGCILWVLLPNG